MGMDEATDRILHYRKIWSLCFKVSPTCLEFLILFFFMKLFMPLYCQMRFHLFSFLVLCSFSFIFLFFEDPSFDGERLFLQEFSFWRTS
jgi:hypothetical protein